MKIKLAVVLGIALLFVTVRDSQAQYYREGAQLVGLSVGLNFTDSDVPIGLNYENAIKREIGIGGIFRYWSRTTFHFSDGGTYVWNTELIGVQANYHFKVPQRELDPFIGAVLGYGFNQGSAHNTIYETFYSVSAPESILFAIQAGARYFISDNIALVGKLAFGNDSYNVLEVGGDFSL
jgi:hypothetical protein